MIFTPQGNDSDACAGIQEFTRSRPVPTQAFRAGNLALFVFSLSLWSGSIIWCYIYRKHSHMRTVRPFTSNLLMGCSNIILSVALSLNLAIPNLPCGILMTSLLFGLGGMSIHFQYMLFIFLLESYFSQVVGNNARVLKVQNSSLEDSSSESSSLKQKADYRDAMVSFIKFFIGFHKLTDLNFNIMVLLRSGYFLIVLTVCIPVLLAIVLLLIFLPQYHSPCIDCALFLDPFIAFLGMYCVYGLASSRVIWVIRKSHFVDSKGIYFQLGLAMGPAAPFGITALVLAIIDPENAEFNFQFMYFEWLWQILMHTVYWYAMIGEQMRVVYQSQKQKRIQPNKESGYANWSEVAQELDSQPELREEFEQYTIHHFSRSIYCLCSLYIWLLTTPS